jgi:hypothetical protein
LIRHGFEKRVADAALSPISLATERHFRMHIEGFLDLLESTGRFIERACSHFDAKISKSDDISAIGQQITETRDSRCQLAPISITVLLATHFRSTISTRRAAFTFDAMISPIITPPSGNM